MTLRVASAVLAPAGAMALPFRAGATAVNLRLGSRSRASVSITYPSHDAPIGRFIPALLVMTPGWKETILGIVRTRNRGP